MTDISADEAVGPKKASKLPLILGLTLAIVGGAGGFLAVRSGLLFGSATEAAAASHATDHAGEAMPPLDAGSFVTLDPVLINLPADSGHQYLRFAANLEVPPQYLGEVEAIRPRIVDVINGYLRALEVSDFQESGALVRLRSQMLRRVQVVTGEGRVRDLLVMEFVLN